ncbi:hypothetical protein KDM41_05235 [bacterium]|nr:hypothetical protein [bacterium]
MKTLLPLSLLIVALTATAPARADSRVDIIPSVAYINPTTDVVDQDGITARFDATLGFGGRIAIYLNETVSLDLSGHYGRSSLAADIFGDPDAASVDLALFYGSAQLAVALGSEKRFILHGGVGLQGTNYDDFIEGGNIMTGVLGLSGWMPLSPTAALRVDFDAHFHTTYFEVGDVRTDELSQLDTVLAVGIQFTSGGR